MPKVGNKHFAYTPAGYRAAAKARKATKDPRNVNVKGLKVKGPKGSASKLRIQPVGKPKKVR